MTAKILQFVKRDRVAAKSNAVQFDDDGPIIKEKPAAKSSTSALIAQPGNIACPVCGHRFLPPGVKCNKGCGCHDSWNQKP